MSWVAWLPLGSLALYLTGFLLFLVWPVKVELEGGLTGLTGRFRATILIWPRFRIQLVARSIQPGVETGRLGALAELDLQSGWEEPTSRGKVKEIVTPQELEAIKRLPILTFARRWVDQWVAVISRRNIRHPSQHPLSSISISSFFREATKKATRVCERLEVNVRLGMHDAAYTAVGSGLLWAVSGFFVSLANRRFRFLTAPRVSVTPDYRETGFDLGVLCILRVDKGQILTEGVRILLTRAKGAIIGGRRWASH